ncbi:MAG: aldose epimerase family protein [Bullifex sp.]
MSIERKPFGKLPDGTDIERITIRDGRIEASVLTLGAALNSLKYTFDDGRVRETVSGSESLMSYVDDSTYKGQVVAPFANRIRNASFTLDGETFELDRNNGKNNLHSGSANTGYKVWTVLFTTENGVVLNSATADGEGGWPGNTGITVTYMVKDDALFITYQMSSDRKCVVNPTNHAYFNLNGCDTDCRKQTIMINASKYIKTDDELIPVSVDPVDEYYDFRTPHVIGDRRDGKYDTCFVLDSDVAAVLSGDDLEMTVTTDRPCMQLYTGEFFSSREPRERGDAFTALALETSAHIDPMNFGPEGEGVLEAGDAFRSVTSYSLREKKA